MSVAVPCLSAGTCTGKALSRTPPVLTSAAMPQLMPTLLLLVMVVRSSSGRTIGPNTMGQSAHGVGRKAAMEDLSKFQANKICFLLVVSMRPRRWEDLVGSCWTQTIYTFQWPRLAVQH